MNRSLRLIGAGNLGGALISAWVSKLEDVALCVIEPRPSERLLAICADHEISLNKSTNEGVDICVLAIKPQLFDRVLPSLDWPGFENTLFVSIAAGLSIAKIETLLSRSEKTPKLVRAMPNLPAAIGQGVTLLRAAREHVSDADRAMVTTLFEAVGKTVWTASEDQLDRLMGITGCGPAYIFLLAEVLEEVAEDYGASQPDARLLAEATIIGAANHLLRDGRPASELRDLVTSSGGTTAEALGVLNGDPSLRSLLKAAVNAAYKRAQALSLNIPK